MATLLIVEDDTSLRRLYEAEFTEEGYSVTGVASGEEAIIELAASSPAAVVLDIHLAGMNGLEVLRRLLDGRPEVAVILNSAYPTYKQNFVSWSADQYVVKSSDLRELKSAVATAIAGRACAD